MTILTACALSAFQSVPQDTVVMVASPTLLSTAEAISTIVLGVAVLAVWVALLAVLLQLRKLGRSVRSVAKRLEKDAAPVMNRARSVAENVDFVTMAIRTDVQKLNALVSSLNDRLKEASVQMEERVQDFTALVEVLQNEAEDLALDTAAAVRGVRAGTRSLTAERPAPTPRSVPAGSPDPHREAAPTVGATSLEIDLKRASATKGSQSPYVFPSSSEVDEPEE